MGALKSRKPVVKKSPIYILEQFLDEGGILRVGGRLKNAPLPKEAQHPIILPKSHHVSKLVARRAHEFQCGHSGKEYVLSLIRSSIRKERKARSLADGISTSRKSNARQPPFFICWCGLFQPFRGEEGPEPTEMLRLLIHLPYYVSYRHREA